LSSLLEIKDFLNLVRAQMPQYPSIRRDETPSKQLVFTFTAVGNTNSLAIPKGLLLLEW
jgi:hypothetical protein